MTPMSFMRGPKNALDVIPWLDHGIQKQLKIRIYVVFLTGSRDQVAG